MAETETQHSVERLDSCLFSHAAAVLSLAFRDDPALTSILHRVSPDVRLRKLTVMFRELLAAGSRRSVPLGIVSDGVVSAVAMLHRPGTYPLPLRTQLAILVRAVARLGPRGLGRFIHFSSRIERHHPAFPHFHLELLAVHPDHQGQGLGSAILQAITSTLDCESLPCTLETANPRNVVLYRRFGFEVVGEEEILGVPIWFMLRQPITGSH